MSPDTLDRLRKYDTPTICNVLELFDAIPRTSGYTDARIKACYPALPPMVGFASTATFRAASPPRGGDIYAGLAAQVEHIAEKGGPQVVVFQDLDDPPVAATFGEVMCTTYQAFGCVGLVTSGAGRDLDQVEALRFPCFTSGTIASHGWTQILDLGGPVRVGNLWINPGDLLHGDRNGLVVIPPHLAAATADGCPELMAAERVVLDYLKGGTPTAAGFGAARVESHARIAELSRRLKSLVGSGR